MKNKIQTVAAYIRVSTQEQKLHGLSLDAQKMKLTEYAENHNLKIVEWYMDEGVSGRKLIKNRPELQRMIHDAQKGNFGRIIFIKLDRFFRSIAEYHECMKLIDPVIWTATEEKYDLSTANGRAFVNMKLTIAELEADQTGERIRLVNEYKVKTGQPLYGSHSLPMGYIVQEVDGKKKVVKDPDTEHIVEDLIEYFLTYQNKRKTLFYINKKYGMNLSYYPLSRLLTNEILTGAYRDNPTYTEAYIDRPTFDRVQEILKRNIGNKTVFREYYFSGLIVCPCCGHPLKGTIKSVNKNGKKYVYKLYRCGKWMLNRSCIYGKAVSENVMERYMLAEIENLFEAEKVNLKKIESADYVKPTENIEEIYEQMDRLNYSWQTGKIRNVEQYEAQYEELSKRLTAAQEEKQEEVKTDFSHIEKALQDGWKGIYETLDDAHKQAFWRSFIKSIEMDENKEVKRVNFF